MRCELFMGALLLVSATMPQAWGDATSAKVVIAVLDSGLRSSNQAFAPGQVVAWWDFTNISSRNLSTWDPVVQQPYDDYGHGTLVASAAAGIPLAATTRSYAPGASLAIGKVMGNDGRVQWPILTEGVEWAVDVVHADIISLSLGGSALAPDRGLDEALSYARSHGVLVIAGAGNTGTFSWTHETGSSGAPLIVGGARGAAQAFCADARLFTVCTGEGEPEGAGADLDPIVVADYTGHLACNANDSCVNPNAAGTSVSTAFAAGFAAHLLQQARDEGRDLTADQIEWLVKESAYNHTLYPWAVYGYGYLDDAALARATAILDGTQPPPDDAQWNLTKFYFEDVRPYEEIVGGA